MKKPDNSKYLDRVDDHWLGDADHHYLVMVYRDYFYYAEVSLNGYIPEKDGWGWIPIGESEGSWISGNAFADGFEIARKHCVKLESDETAEDL